ncbi:MAG: alpha-galactosidase [Spirochaetes bacterium]|nr:MAG: alpha-galactosidase [Spirochaetota bacterium]
MININKDGPVFHLQAGRSSYIISILEGRYLIHGYWGGRVETVNPFQLFTLGTRPYSVTESMDSEHSENFNRHWISNGGSLSDKGQLNPESAFSPERLPLEYPTAGIGDLRKAALQIRNAAGSPSCFLEYRDYELIEGFPGPSGLPYISEPPETCQTLRIGLVDQVIGLRVDLYYLPLPSLSIILRWNRIQNNSETAVDINHASSASMDFPGDDMDMITLNGSWGRERNLHRRAIAPGIQSIESRGGTSSHQHSPFIALASRDATETNGTVFAASLIYSGNHRHLVEQDQYGSLRLQCGINPNGFSIHLPPGESFDTPAAVLAWSDSGLTGISDNFHPFVRHYLLPALWRDRDRPVIVNTWEARYFDVNSQNILELAEQGKEIGGEVLVLDDGWFENRKDDKRALGDWVPDSVKFPGGLSDAVNKIRNLGMGFGIWVEPEMVNRDSELFRRHPEWILGSTGRKPVLARNQIVLNLGKSEVVEHLLDVLSGLFSSTPISYVKWDMNRYMAETDEPETPHRYMLGLYRLWSTLVSRFPHILFEGCAGGGGRFDFGSLAYMPQFWTSDQTDAVERQRIQFGTSVLFPPETMGAHVSAVPNHLIGRITSAESRGLTALCFNFGFELDLTIESEKDKAVYSRLSRLYKKYRTLFRTGRFLRLLPELYHFNNSKSHQRDSHAWSIVSTDKNESIVFYFQAMANPNDDGRWLRISGLEEHSSYMDVEKQTIHDSAFLMNRGLWIPPAAGDYRSVFWILKKVENK